MSSTKKFFKSSMVYFMGNVLTKIISFFLLPLYTTRISTDEYGYFNTSTNYLDILIAILCMEIWSVIMRFMFDYEGRRGKEKAITNGLVIFVCRCWDTAPFLLCWPWLWIYSTCS